MPCSQTGIQLELEDIGKTSTSNKWGEANSWASWELLSWLPSYLQNSISFFPFPGSKHILLCFCLILSCYKYPCGPNFRSWPSNCLIVSCYKYSCCPSFRSWPSNCKSLSNINSFLQTKQQAVKYNFKSSISNPPVSFDWVSYWVTFQSC